jgi:hypothetical protein
MMRKAGIQLFRLIGLHAHVQLLQLLHSSLCDTTNVIDMLLCFSVTLQLPDDLR